MSVDTQMWYPTCIHGIVCNGENHCPQCEALGTSPDYNPNVTVQELEELLCDEPTIVEASK